MRQVCLTQKKLVLLVAGLLVFSACRQSTGEKTESTILPHEDPAESGFDIEIIDRQIVIRMTGADNADFEGSSQLRIQSPNKDAPLNLMVISTDGYIDVGGGVKLSIGISLAGVYQGDGEYTLPPNIAPPADSTPDPKNPATLSSNSRVTFYADNSSGPEHTLRAYDTLSKSCPVVIRDKGKTGEVRCPEIRSVEKTTVSFDMVWK